LHQYLNKLQEFIAKLLGSSDRPSADKLVSALTDVVEFGQNTVMKVRAGDGKQTIGGDKRRLTEVYSLAPVT